MYSISKRLKMSEIVDMSNEKWAEVLADMKKSLASTIEGKGLNPVDYKYTVYDKLNEERRVILTAEKRR